MNAILGFSQVLEQNSENHFSKEDLELIGEILTAGYHLLELINEVLDLAKIESGKFDIKIDRVSMNEIMNQCLPLISQQAVSKGIELVDEISDKNILVYADVFRLKQVFLNLLSNAIKYNHENGTVTVSCLIVDDGNVRICISDTGKGLSEKDKLKLFTSFERLDAVNNVEGTGIGLVITKRLIELMNGRVGVDSSIGKGSVFWFELELVGEE